jgi:hypothetical protein
MSGVPGIYRIAESLERLNLNVSELTRAILGCQASIEKIAKSIEKQANMDTAQCNQWV